MALNKKTRGNYVSVVQGTIRQEVPENTVGAVRRDFKRQDGTTGVKFEKIFDSLSGKITRIAFYESEYGKQMYVTIKDGEIYILQLNATSSYCEDLMTKLPNIDFEKQIELDPYDFEDKGNRKQGMTVIQNDNKLYNYFIEIEKDENGKTKNIKNINGMIEPEGDKDTYSKEDWKIYYLLRNKFLVGYTIENIVPKIPEDAEENTTQEETRQGENVSDAPDNLKVDGTDIDYPESTINPEDIPF